MAVAAVECLTLPVPRRRRNFGKLFEGDVEIRGGPPSLLEVAVEVRLRGLREPVALLVMRHIVLVRGMRSERSLAQ